MKAQSQEASNTYMAKVDPCSGDVTLQSYFERIIKEHQEAIRIADAEREKTAQNVRRALEADMKGGDDRLQDHITHQIEQVKQGLTSLNAILVERDGRSDDRWKSHERQFTEFKETVTDRFKQVNEFRGALDDLGKFMATSKELNSLEDKLTPMLDRNREDVNKRVTHETFQSSIQEWSLWRGMIDKWKNEQTGKGEGIGSTARIVMTVAVFVATLLGIISFFLSVSNSTKIDQNAGRTMNQPVR